MRTLLALLRKEFLQIRRDRMMLRQVIAMPIVQLVILSSAATFEVKTARMYVVDRDHSVTSRALVDRLRVIGQHLDLRTATGPPRFASGHGLVTLRDGLLRTADPSTCGSGHGRRSMKQVADERSAGPQVRQNSLPQIFHVCVEPCMVARNQSCCACTPGGVSIRRSARTGGSPYRRRR